MKNIIIVIFILLNSKAIGQTITLDAKHLTSSVKTATPYSYSDHARPSYLNIIYNYELTFIDNNNQNFTLNCKSSHPVVLFLGREEYPGNLMMYPGMVGVYYTFELEKVCINDISCKYYFYNKFCTLQSSNCALVISNPSITTTNDQDYLNTPKHVEYNGELYLVKRIITNDKYNWDFMQGQGFDR